LDSQAPGVVRNKPACAKPRMDRLFRNGGNPARSGANWLFGTTFQGNEPRGTDHRPRHCDPDLPESSVCGRCGTFDTKAETSIARVSSRRTFLERETHPQRGRAQCPVSSSIRPDSSHKQKGRTLIHWGLEFTGTSYLGLPLRLDSNSIGLPWGVCR